MNKQVSFKFEDSLKALRKELEGVPPRLEAAVNEAIRDTAYAAFASIQAKAQAELNSTRQDYLKALDIQDLGDNSYLIVLEGDWPNKLEEGYAAFTMNKSMLQSTKTVEVGPRAGLPWVQHGKNGKFANVPFEHQPFAKTLTPKGADMADAIRQMTGVGANNVKQKITKIFKDPLGNPLQGKVATGKSDNPLVNNLSKFQRVQKSATGKDTVQSIYMTWRTISENGKSWVHPGYEGLKAFEEAEKDIMKNIDQIINTLL